MKHINIHNLISLGHSIKNLDIYTDFRIFVKQKLFNVDVPESVYFFTFHKCASSLFSNYILKNSTDLKNKDYAIQIYRGRIKSSSKIKFKEKGYIYGPIRLSDHPNLPLHKLLVNPATRDEFIMNKKAIFFIRDPRDILVSAYYSFGYRHTLSPVKDIRDKQLSIREQIRKGTIDDYAIDFANFKSDNFQQLYKLANICKNSVIIKYEDMINNYDYFLSQLRNFIAIDDNVAQEIYNRTRPRHEEDISQHKRSGKTGSFRDKLKEETIDELNKKLEKTLNIFQYEL